MKQKLGLLFIVLVQMIIIISNKKKMIHRFFKNDSFNPKVLGGFNYF